jgi:hypothetical protein
LPPFDKGNNEEGDGNGDGDEIGDCDKIEDGDGDKIGENADKGNNDHDDNSGEDEIQPEEEIQTDQYTEELEEEEAEEEEVEIETPEEPQDYGTYGNEPIVYSRRMHSPSNSRSNSQSPSNVSSTNKKSLDGYGQPAKPYDPNLTALAPEGDRDAFADKIRSRLDSIQVKVPPKKNQQDSRGRKFGNNKPGPDDLEQLSNPKMPLLAENTISKPTQPRNISNGPSKK